MVYAKDYDALKVSAARSVLLELSHLLRAYSSGIVIVGGWVPGLLFPGMVEQHIGSTDVDLALDRKILQEVGYRSILELLLARGYRQGDQPFIFYRTLKIQNLEFDVEVDFLASQYGGTGKKHRTQTVQDMHPRKTRGCDLAFEKPMELIIKGVLPDGGLDQTSIRVVSIAPFIIMKAFALGDRLKEKDAYDIYYCLKNYPGGMKELIDEFHPHIHNALVKEGLNILLDKFISPEHIGPRFVADFLEITDPEDRAALQRDVFERVIYLLKGLGL
ncbi:MAG: nucleotidyl transferase AbiEii/AbiGii toxin family protein [Anaerolineaceae bacterium]